MPNPLVDDRTVSFLLYDVLRAEELTELDGLSEHSRETFDLYIDAARKLAREVLFPEYKTLDEHPPKLEDGRVIVHPVLGSLYRKMIELGMANATRPEEVGGQSLPMTVAAMANVYVMAANLSAYGYVGLTTSAARLIESFGSEELKEVFMSRMYGGEWTGTMALTEPQAGSSLSDVKTRATPTADGHYLIQGSKIFISGADQNFTENVVHMTLARIDGAPPGIKGISLFAVPNRRPEDGTLVDNDTSCAGVIHKIGWKGIPSLALNYGENGDCRGWLVGEPNRGISYMFQMMNEARLMVGLNGVATASVAYQEALEYAKTRPQGRPLGRKNPELPQVPIVEHADVRRMLLRQKAIVEGALCLLGTCAKLTDLSEHAATKEDRDRAFHLLDLLTPVAKSFPAEKGFEANVLAVQVLGGYGYSSEYLPEAFLRDQKLNSLHEGTTGIQSLDLLGRKVHQAGGAGMAALLDEVGETLRDARSSNVPESWCAELESATTAVRDVTRDLTQMGASAGVDQMLLHSVDYLDLFGTWVIGWMWLRQAAVAKKRLETGGSEEAFWRGKLSAAQYWTLTELPRIGHLAKLCRDAEDSYARVQPEWL